MASGGRLGDALGEQPAQRLLAGDEQLALVGEVPEEGALGDAGALGDLRDGRGVVPLLGEQVDGGDDEPLARARFPSSHAAILAMGLLSHHAATVMGQESHHSSGELPCTSSSPAAPA